MLSVCREREGRTDLFFELFSGGLQCFRHTLHAPQRDTVSVSGCQILSSRIQLNNGRRSNPRQCFDFLTSFRRPDLDNVVLRQNSDSFLVVAERDAAYTRSTQVRNLEDVPMFQKAINEQ